MATKYTKDKPYQEVGINYYEDESGNKYKNGVIVPETNYKYLPTNVGGTRGVTDTSTDTAGGLSFGYSPETVSYLESLKTAINTPFQYDPKTDPLYAPMRESYTNMGQNAFQNTVGLFSFLDHSNFSMASFLSNSVTSLSIRYPSKLV